MASMHVAADHARRQRQTTLWRWIVAPLSACALIGISFWTGTQYRRPNAPAPIVTTDDGTKRALQDLQAKVDRIESMNQLVAAALEQQQQRPANDRLRGVLTSASLSNPSDEVISELITSLALDPSANVRLRALEALYPHADRDVVRAGVLASLSRESNPLVQVQMIDFLAAARDRAAKPALEKISVADGADQSVRTAARRALAQL